MTALPGGRAFRDRVDAGQVLALELRAYRGRPDVVVLGLPRGGVPVAREVATSLGATLDVLVVRKLGVPGHPELAMGAIASGGVRVLNPTVVDSLGISPSAIDWMIVSILILSACSARVVVMSEAVIWLNV